LRKEPNLSLFQLLLQVRDLLECSSLVCLQLPCLFLLGGQCVLQGGLDLPVLLLIGNS